MFLLQIKLTNGALITKQQTYETLQAPPSAPPEKVAAMLNGTSVQIHWVPPPPQSVNGILTGYVVSYISYLFNQLIFFTIKYGYMLYTKKSTFHTFLKVSDFFHNRKIRVVKTSQKFEEFHVTN